MADAEKVRLTDDQLLRLRDSGRDDLIGKLNPTELIRMKSLGGAPKPTVKPEVHDRPDVELPITASMGPQPPSEGAIPAIFKGLVSTAETMTGVPRGTAGAFKDAAVETAREVATTALELPGDFAKQIIEGIRSVDGHELAVPAQVFNQIGGYAAKSMIPGTGESASAGEFLVGLPRTLSRTIFGFQRFPGQPHGTPEATAAGQAILTFGAEFLKERTEYAKKWFDDPVKTSREDPLKALEFLGDLAIGGTVAKQGGKTVIRFMGHQTQAATTRYVSKVIGEELATAAVNLQRTMAKHNIEMSSSEAWAAVRLGAHGTVDSPSKFRLWEIPLDDFKKQMAGLADQAQLEAEWMRSTKAAVNEGLLKKPAANRLAGFKADDPKRPFTGRSVKPRMGTRIQDPPVIDETIPSILRIAKDGDAVVSAPVPRPHGKLREWMLEAGTKEGAVGYDEWRRASNQYDYMVRVIGDNVNELFAGVKGETRDQIVNVLRGVNRRDGELVFGGIARAGTLKRPGGKEGLLFDAEFPPGTLLEDGRVVGPPDINNPGRIITYRVIESEAAKAAYEALPQKGKDIVNALRAEIEEPVILANGERRPAISFNVLKDQFGIKGLEEEEAAHASALMRQAYGKDAFPHQTNWTFNYVPEHALKGDSLHQRARSSMSIKGRKPDNTKFKAGKTFESVVHGGEEVDLVLGMKKGMAQVYAQPLHDEMGSKILATVAQKMRRGETAASVEKEGFYVFSKTGLFKDSERVRQFWRQNEGWFKSQDLDVHQSSEAVEAALKAGGKGYKIPMRIADDLGAKFSSEVLSTDPILRETGSKMSTAFGELISIPLIGWLTKVSTANRNMLSQTATFAPKVIRDTYIGALDAIPAYRRGEMPFQEVISDFTAFRTVGKFSRGQMPPELFGSTFVQELENGLISNRLGQVLRYTGFNYWDVASKRLVWESVIDAKSKASWHRAVRFKTTNGLAKEDWIRKWRSNIPKDVEHLAYREMDMWGAYDYQNVPAWLERLKRSHAWRGVFPYATFPYKLMTTYSELYSPINVVNAFAPNSMRRGLGKMLEATPVARRARMTAKQLQEPVGWEQRRNALANMLTATTISTPMLLLIGDDGSPSDEIKDPMIRELTQQAEASAGRKVKEKDLPYQVQRFGRAKAPDFVNRMIFGQPEGGEPNSPEEAEELKGLIDDKALWVRFYDIPFWGEHAAAKAIWKGEMTPGQFLMDRMTMGPMMSMVMAISGLSDEYNEHLPVASRVGKATTGFVPLSNELRVGRQLIDPSKREQGREEFGTVQNFLAAVQDNMPIASIFLHPRLKKSDYSLPTYNRWETLGSYAILNARAQSDEEREALIALTAIQNLSDTRDQLNRDLIAGLIEKVRRADGSTLVGEAKKFAQTRSRAMAVDLGKVIISTEMERAFIDGGLKASVEVGEKLFMEYLEKNGPNPRDVLETLKQKFRRNVAITDAGLRGIAFQQLPERQRSDFLNYLLSPDPPEMQRLLRMPGEPDPTDTLLGIPPEDEQK